ncbi:MAG: DUF4166 domain-containing protein [Pseudomonadota bacterium]
MPETAQTAPVLRDGQGDALGDLRFRALLSKSEWNSLPLAVRRRFSKRLAGGQSVVYAGVLTAAKRNLLGALMAETLRLIGAPLPLSMDTGLPSIVSVTEDIAGGGQIWSRLHCNRHGFPQAIHSAKRFSGPTGLEEFLGTLFSIALGVRAEGDTLVFESDHFALHLAGRRMRLPRLVAPGRLTVRHRELGDGQFEFSLDLTHRWFGVLLQQIGIYRESTT